MQTHETNCAVAEQLSGYLDDELTQQEQQRVMVHIRTCHSCKALLEEMITLRGDMKRAVHVSADARDLPKVMNDRSARFLGWFGWIALVLGALLLTTFFFWDLAVELLTDRNVPWWVRLGIAGVYLGFIGLFLMVLRQRLIASKTDKYKKVKL